MITGAIKNKVDKIWTDIWAGGITNPLTVIEQLTYLTVSYTHRDVYKRQPCGSAQIPSGWTVRT